MKIKKICEYLSDIGLLEINDINWFLNVYSQIDSNKCKRDLDKLKIALFSYINTISKNDQLLFKICRNIIDSFINKQIVLKYKALNSISNIFKNKLKIIHNQFFYKLNLFILRKKKNKVIVQPRYIRANKIEKNNKDKNELEDNENKKPRKFNINDINNNDPKNRITADDVRECTFSPCINNYKPHKEKTENVKSYTYYSPAFNILAKMPYNMYNKNKININKENPTDNKLNVNLNLSERCNTYNDNNKNNIYSKNTFSALDIFNNKKRMISDYNYDNNYINNYFNQLNKEYNINKTRAKTPRQNPIKNNEIINSFLLKQENHVKDVEQKIINLKLEQRNKEERECSFSPEIHAYNGENRYNRYLNNLNNFYSNKNDYINNNSNYFNSNRSLNFLYNLYNNSNINNNRNYICPKFEGALSSHEDNFTKELYDLVPQSSKSKKSVNKEFFNKLSNENSEKNIRMEELRKKVENYTFTPKIEYNNKYKVKDSFEERQTKYIENKKKLQNLKEENEKSFIDDMNKMYGPKSKSKDKDIIDRLYNKEEVDKIKERNKKDENKPKSKSIINWNKRLKKSKTNNNNNNMNNIYEFSHKNKIVDKKKSDINNNNTDIKNEKK